MTENGIVTKVHSQFATVRIGRHSACGACGKCGMTTKQRYVDFFAANLVDAQVGDTVEVDIKDANVAKLAIFAYLIPLAIGIALFFVGFALRFPDWGNLLMFLVGFAIAIAIVAVIDKKKRHTWTVRPEIMKIINKGGTADE